MKKNLLLIGIVALAASGCASGSIRDGVKPLAANPITAVAAAPVMLGIMVADIVQVADNAREPDSVTMVQPIVPEGEVVPIRRRVWQYRMGISKEAYNALDNAEYEALIYSLDHPEPE